MGLRLPVKASILKSATCALLKQAWVVREHDATIFTPPESLRFVLLWAVLGVEQVDGEKPCRYPKNLKSVCF